MALCAHRSFDFCTIGRDHAAHSGSVTPQLCADPIAKHVSACCMCFVGLQAVADAKAHAPNVPMSPVDMDSDAEAQQDSAHQHLQPPQHNSLARDAAVAALASCAEHDVATDAAAAAALQAGDPDEAEHATRVLLSDNAPLQHRVHSIARLMQRGTARAVALQRQLDQLSALCNAPAGAPAADAAAAAASSSAAQQRSQPDKPATKAELVQQKMYLHQARQSAEDVACAACAVAQRLAREEARIAAQLVSTGAPGRRSDSRGGGAEAGDEDHAGPSDQDERNSHRERRTGHGSAMATHGQSAEQQVAQAADGMPCSRVDWAAALHDTARGNAHRPDTGTDANDNRPWGNTVDAASSEDYGKATCGPTACAIDASHADAGARGIDNFNTAVAQPWPAQCAQHHARAAHMAAISKQNATLPYQPFDVASATRRAQASIWPVGLAGGCTDAERICGQPRASGPLDVAGSLVDTQHDCKGATVAQRGSSCAKGVDDGCDLADGKGGKKAKGRALARLDLFDKLKSKAQSQAAKAKADTGHKHAS